ncbi:hypothetical protein HK103_002976 [Boothiomyces macroporosus]|uniref:K Homology domain-containing protein n=1 Tax=Boothiomyces macroporosus TaxID=261099 RepID=A0AAD5UJA8_9FUNG|nr:hypothetical protein HK103_002976 [Boothiomyces macroporosus]
MEDRKSPKKRHLEDDEDLDTRKRQAHEELNESKSTPYYSSKDDSNHRSDSKQIKMRALVSTREAGIIIGKGGGHVAEIKDLTGVKVMVTPQVQGVPDRIMTVLGPQNNLGRAMNMVVTRLLEKAEYNDRDSKENQITLRVLVPSQKMGSVIGKGGSKIKELQSLTGATMFTHNENLGNSNERVLNVIGDVKQMVEAWEELSYIFGDYHLRRDVEPCVLYEPGRSQSNYNSPPPSYPAPQAQPLNQAQLLQMAELYANYYPQLQMMAQMQGYQIPVPFVQPQLSFPAYSSPYSAPYSPSIPAQIPKSPETNTAPQTQEMTIPADLVGAIIGKNGCKIKEIRNSSGSQVKFADPVEGSPTRTVWIIGSPENNARAIYMLHARVEAEKIRYGKN